MKKLLLLSFFATLYQFTNKANSQTLQFSRVLLVSTTQTVPANKVWKVESVVPYSQNSVWHEVVVNSLISMVGQVGIVQGAVFNTFPMWLPAGTTLAAGQKVNYVSVIEFTVVP